MYLLNGFINMFVLLLLQTAWYSPGGSTDHKAGMGGLEGHLYPPSSIRWEGLCFTPQLPRVGKWWGSWVSSKQAHGKVMIYGVTSTPQTSNRCLLLSIPWSELLLFSPWDFFCISNLPFLWSCSAPAAFSCFLPFPWVAPIFLLVWQFPMDSIKLSGHMKAISHPIIVLSSFSIPWTTARDQGAISEAHHMVLSLA